jgi:hypothetical protein
VAAAALLSFLLLEFRQQGLHVRVLFIALMTAALAGIAASTHPLALLLASGRRAAQYAAFFLALGVLRDAAQPVRSCSGVAGIWSRNRPGCAMRR